MSRAQATAPALWPIRRVVQQHEHGCGIACVAMLAGVSYGQVCRDMFGDLEGDITSLEDLCAALQTYGLHVSRRATPFWESGYEQLSQHALLITDPDRFGLWHAAVWDARRRRIVDPLPRPKWHPVVVGYLAVHRPASWAGSASRSQVRPTLDGDHCAVASVRFRPAEARPGERRGRRRARQPNDREHRAWD